MNTKNIFLFPKKNKVKKMKKKVVSKNIEENHLRSAAVDSDWLSGYLVIFSNGVRLKRVYDLSEKNLKMKTRVYDLSRCTT